MAKSKTINVHRPGNAVIEIDPDRLPEYEAIGYRQIDGEPVVDDTPELSKADIDAELAAVEKRVRREGKKKGLDKSEIDADVAAELSRKKIELGVE